MSHTKTIRRIKQHASQGYGLPEEEVRGFLMDIRELWRTVTRRAGYDENDIKTIQRKFYDAGRRSPPWEATSSRVPGRPQDGSDGNRQKRWLFDEDHKYYASELMATLVEIKFFLQALSMKGAPELPDDQLKTAFDWMLEQPVKPGEYLDPIQRKPIELSTLLNEPTEVESAHLVPLDRGGRHEPDNAVLMLKRSNRIQGNRTVDEMVDILEGIVRKHRSEDSL